MYNVHTCFYNLMNGDDDSSYMAWHSMVWITFEWVKITNKK